MLDVREGLRRSARWFSARPAVISGERTLTYAEAWDRGLRFANAMLSLGLLPGDRVAVLEDNCIEAADFFLGTAAANLVRVPLYKRNSPASHLYMMRNTGCRGLVISEQYLCEVDGLKAQLPELEHIIVRGSGYESWLQGFSNADPNPPISLDDYYVIRHSGGTSGQPKGMAFSHRAWMNTERDWTYRMPPIEAGDYCVHIAPISHGSGYLFVPIWLLGGCNVLEPKFEASRALDLLDHYGGYFFAVPTIISDLLASNDGKLRKFAKLKVIVISGAPIRPQTAKAAHELFGDVLHQFFGQTESTPIVWMTPKEWFGEQPGSEPLLAVGRVMPFAQAEIRDENNHPVANGEVGEIAVKADGQMQKIWNEPELTAQRLVDGWVLTGDIGRFDANGFLYLVDRKDDMIISGGLNIWPAELEISIAALPQVREVAVVGAPHPRWGETPVAVVVLHEGAKLTEEDVTQACARDLGSYKKPSKVVLQYSLLPRTAVGKIQRKLVREPFWAGTDARLGAS